MGESTSDSDVFNVLAYEFAERYRRGERPALSEYISRHPELADEIRDLFPTLVMMERLGESGDGRLSECTPERTQTGRSIPERLGDYRILREIGRGGMGVVYEAVQESLGRHVALKVLSHHRHLGSIQLIRFQREARAAALLHHTNIVPVFGVGVHGDVHYYAMQYIQGQGLDCVIRELVRLRRTTIGDTEDQTFDPENISAHLASKLLKHRMPPQPSQPSALQGVLSAPARPEDASAASGSTIDTGSPLIASPPSSSILGHREARYFRSVARLGLQVAEALAYAHSHGVVHRDIKPANLLLDLQGTIWVTDFGLAKAHGHDELTSPGDVVGTLRYMAPERFRGKADSRCDIFSLGVTLYEMLTLKPAFTASHRAQLINSIIHVEPTRLRRLDSQIPRDLETIILKAIAKNPADRFQTADEMAKELGRFVEGRPIRSRRASPPERLWRWSRRNPAVASLLLVAVTLTSLLALGSTMAAWKFREQRDVVQREQRNTQAKLGEALLLQAQSLRFSRQPGRRAEGLDLLARAARIARNVSDPLDRLEKLRDEVITTLAEVDLHQVQTWPELNAEADSSSFAFDADRYVVLKNRRFFHLYRLSDLSEIRVVKSNDDSFSPTLDPLGRFVIVWSGPSRIDLWDLERGEAPSAWPADVRCATFQPDGRSVAAFLPDGEVRIFDLPAMTETRRCHLGLKFPTRFGREKVALSHDSRYLAVMSVNTRDASVFDLTRNRPVINIKIPPVIPYGSLALNRNATLLAVAHNRVISVYDVGNGDRLAMLHGHQGSGINAWFVPKGDHLVSECWDGLVRLWDPIRGRLLASLPGAVRGVTEAEPKIVVGKNADLILYQMDQGMERRTTDCKKLQEQTDPTLYGPARLAFSPDGAMIAMALRPDGVRIIRTSDGVELARLPIGDCDEVLYLSDGSLLTGNGCGLCRWPVRPLGSRALQIGPPEPLAPWQNLYAGWVAHGLASSANGRLVGIINWAPQSSLLLDREQPWRRTWLAPVSRVYDLAISPDGRWAATALDEGYQGSERVKIWEATSGQLRREIPGFSSAAFSPNGRWLGMNDRNSYRFLETGRWTPVCQFDHKVYVRSNAGAMRMAFHPVGNIAAIMDADWTTVRLVDIKNRREIASLKGTDDAQLHCIVFSPDGRFLVVSHLDQKVDLWDLSLIRQRLQDLDLVAGFPDVFGGIAASTDSSQIERIEVHGADPAGLRILAARQTLRDAGFVFRRLLEPNLSDPEELRRRGDVWYRMGLWRRAVADYRASLARRPQSGSTANELAWSLVAMPGRGDPEEAVRSARKAVDLDPANPDYTNTLGVALYRAGRLAEAAAILKRNASRNYPMTGYDWVFVAMCQGRIGRAEDARKALTQALRWRAAFVRLTPVQSVEFQTFLQEAQALLGASTPDLPPDVFDRGT
jgi:serine/threonine protein kinase/WD40 repeat protein